MTDSGAGTPPPTPPGGDGASPRHGPQAAGGGRRLAVDEAELPPPEPTVSPRTSGATPKRRPERGRRSGTWFDLAVPAGFAVMILLLMVHLPGGTTEQPAEPTAGTAATAAASVTTPSTPGTGGDAVDGVTLPDAPVDASVVPAKGSGRARFLPIPGRDSGAAGRAVSYTVAVEGGLGVRVDDFPATVRSILASPRGWESVDPIHFVAVSPRQAAAGVRPDVQIILASPDLVDQLCHPLQTHGEVSCFNNHRVVINARRWMAGAAAYGSDLAGYRTYLVNHEVGHALGRGHATCARAGRPAPVMLQQTLGLGGCRPYPYPR